MDVSLSQSQRIQASSVDDLLSKSKVILEAVRESALAKIAEGQAADPKDLSKSFSAKDLGDSLIEWVDIADAPRKKNIGGAIAKQLGKIQEGVQWLHDEVPEVVTRGAKFYAGAYTFGFAALGLITGGGVIPAVVGIAAGALTLADARGAKATSLGGVDKLLSNAEALVTMVKNQEKMNFADIEKVQGNLTELSEQLKEVKVCEQEIVNKLGKASGDAAKFKAQAETALEEHEKQSTDAQASFKEANALFAKGSDYLKQSRDCIKQIVAALNTPIDCSDKEAVKTLLGLIRTLVAEAESLSEAGYEEMAKAKTKLEEGQRLTNKAATLFGKAMGLLQAALTYHESASKKITSDIAPKLKDAADKAQEATKQISEDVAKIKDRIETNISHLGEAQTTLEKVNTLWDRFLTWGAVTLGVLAAVAIVATTLLLMGTGVGAIGIAVAAGVVGGIALAVGVKNLPALVRFIANKISERIFGKAKKLDAVDLPNKNEVKVKCDNLSSSFWGKMHHRESHTVGYVYTNFGSQEEFRFDLRNKYPIEPADIQAILKGAEKAVRKDPNFDINAFEESLVKFKVNDEGQEYNLLGPQAQGYIDDLRELQKTVGKSKGS